MDYQLAKKTLLDTQRNIFMTGSAGTGKTTLIKEYLEKYPNTIVCAPTGTAAVNCCGETMHSLFGIPVPCYGVNISKTPNAKVKILAKADAIIIDEISMCRNAEFSYAVRILKKAEKIKGSRIRLIVCGDFMQLPPVVTKKDKPYLKKFGYDESGYCFTTKEWQSLNLKVIELDKIYRQDNEDYIKHLGYVRIGSLECMPYFNQFVKENYEEKPDTVFLCGTNAEADKINQEYLNSIEGNLQAFQSEKTGRCSAGIVDDVVLVKEGCRIMFTVNDQIHKEYQNGTFGEIKKVYPNHMDVDINGKVISIFKHEFPIYSYKIAGGNLVKNEIGVVKQFPVKIAKAVTIHKSQGKTFSNVVISPECFAHGQLYVALSRVKSPEGLVLTKPISPEYLVGDDIVDEFYKNGFKYEVKPKRKSPTTKSTVKKKTSTSLKKKNTTKSAKATNKKKSVSVKKTLTKKQTSTKNASVSRKKTNTKTRKQS